MALYPKQTDKQTNMLLAIPSFRDYHKNTDQFIDSNCDISTQFKGWR